MGRPRIGSYEVARTLEALLAPGADGTPSGGYALGVADSEDLVTRALEPGERIVWSDRPHRFRGAWRSEVDARRKTRFELLELAVGLALVCGFLPALGVALVTELVSNARAGRGSDPSTAVCGLAATLPFLAGLGWTLRRLASARGGRYAVTDRGRAFVVFRDHLGISTLPVASTITTDASGAEEFGDIVLGDVGPVFYEVSYPLIAVESIRSVAGERAPGSTP